MSCPPTFIGCPVRRRTAVTDVLESRKAQRRLRWLGAILWPSFLTAGVAAMAFFANVDPETLRYETLPEWDIGRRTGYTIGFFMFWVVCAGSSTLSVWLFSPSGRVHRPGHGNRNETRQ